MIDFEIMVMLTPETISVFYGNDTRLKRRRTYEELLYIVFATHRQFVSLRKQALCSSYSRYSVIQHSKYHSPI